MIFYELFLVKILQLQDMFFVLDTSLKKPLKEVFTLPLEYLPKKKELELKKVGSQNYLPWGPPMNGTSIN